MFTHYKRTMYNIMHITNTIQNSIGTLIDTYIQNYDILVGKTCYECEFGFFTFNNDSEKKYVNEKTIKIFEIYINPEHRRCKIATTFINTVIEKTRKNVIVQAVLSKIMYNLLVKFRYNNKRFLILHGEFTYLHNA